MLPLASFAVTVTLVATPAVTEPGPLTWSVVAGPGVNVDARPSSRSTAALSVPVIEAVPAVVDEVSVAV